ncbi:hypothetical protein FQN53_009346 [Emmonsiellopsis sp. PD_33]|nr:hypothetical protein FQN53_009346 [Emmonsiellopsis sp. PD_33]
MNKQNEQNALLMNNLVDNLNEAIIAMKKTIESDTCLALDPVPQGLRPHYDNGNSANPRRKDELSIMDMGHNDSDQDSDPEGEDSDLEDVVTGSTKEDAAEYSIGNIPGRRIRLWTSQTPRDKA